MRVFPIPANLIPRNADTGTPNYAGDTGNTAGKRTNRGFEGLAISPDGAYVYAMLQSAMLDEGGGDGVCNRIVKFDTETGTAVAQYAYQMEGSSQGRGISALVAINDHEFLVLERNNRGIGVGAAFSPPNKKVYRIDLDGAADVSDVTFAAGACPAGKVTEDRPLPRPGRQHVARARQQGAGEVGGPGHRPAARRTAATCCWRAPTTTTA